MNLFQDFMDKESLKFLSHQFEEILTCQELKDHFLHNLSTESNQYFLNFISRGETLSPIRKDNQSHNVTANDQSIEKDLEDDFHSPS